MPLWITGSASQGQWEARHIAAGSLGTTFVRIMANRREQTLGTWEIHDLVAASSFPGFAPDPSGTAILSTGSCRILGGVSHAVATGRVTSRGLRVGTPGPWAGRAKGRCPGACPFRVFRGTCALLSADLPGCVC